jgi:Zn-dependent M28 family amino/carboxypeptidase
MRCPRAAVAAGLMAALIFAFERGSAGHQTSAATTARVDRAQLMRDLRWLADPARAGRATGTHGGIEARRWIADQFAALGLIPAGSSGYFQPFSPTGRGVSAKDAANVVGRRDAESAGRRALVVSAHYDHLGTAEGKLFPGADDNGSGVAVLLAVARRLVASAPRHPVYFAAFDAEERGLLGARAFLESPPVPPDRMALNINLDMVSRSAARELYASGTFHNPWLIKALDPVRKRSAVTLKYGHDRPEQGEDDWTMQSDHGAFHARRVAYIYFGVENHEDYHQPTDTPDRIDPGFFGDVADTIVDAVVTLDRAIP